MARLAHWLRHARSGVRFVSREAKIWGAVLAGGALLLLLARARAASASPRDPNALGALCVSGATGPTACGGDQGAWTDLWGFDALAGGWTRGVGWLTGDSGVVYPEDQQIDL